ncbi:MAG: hypothetical protein HOP07_05795 [Bacteriovoracaceae bacterium]|nr:hypothetical protein [Bacteriovoracaceae bacterium]
MQFFTHPVYSSDNNKQEWFLGNKKFEFKFVQKYLIESRCIDHDCTSSNLIKKKNIKLDHEKAIGGTSPQSIICTKLPNSKVVILKDKEKNENSFCLFADGSMIDGNSLMNLID